MDRDEGLFLRAPAPFPGLPALLLEWQVEEGETIRKGQTIGQILDGAGCSPLLAPTNGRLLEHWVDEGAVIGEGQRLARLEAEASRTEISPDPPASGQNPA